MMKKLTILSTVGIVSMSATLLFAQPALAWHPEVQVVKKVQNVTAGGALVDANDTKSAVSAKPGDTLRYVIEVSNPAAAHHEGHNDLAKAKLKDELPAGVELVASPAKRIISEDLGTIKPKQKMVKEYTVKVTSTTNDALINNEACVEGNSHVNDAYRKDCDTAKVKVTVPEKPVTPETPKTPEQPKESPKAETPAPAPEKLPETGVSAIGALAGTSAFGYAAHLYLRSKRNLAQITGRRK